MLTLTANEITDGIATHLPKPVLLILMAAMDHHDGHNELLQ